MIISACMSLSTVAAAAPDAKLSDSDKVVLEHQHAVNSMEIDMGKLAEKNGGTAVKAYGKQLVTDHQAADKDAMALGKKHALLVIPNEKLTTDADKADKKMMDDHVAALKKLKGAAFDTEFLAMMVMGHDKEIAKADAAAGTATDADLVTYLKAVKPVMQKHSDDAKALQHDATAPAAK